MDAILILSWFVVGFIFNALHVKVISSEVRLVDLLVCAVMSFIGPMAVLFFLLSLMYLFISDCGKTSNKQLNKKIF